jgi:fructose-1-phosphate kinase PfkB-like protein
VLSTAGRYRVTPPAVPEVNPVGSGDCYLAALAHARLSGFTYTDQLRYAAAAGAANARQLAVATLGPADIEPLMAGVDVRSHSVC